MVSCGVEEGSPWQLAIQVRDGNPHFSQSAREMGTRARERYGGDRSLRLKNGFACL